MKRKLILSFFISLFVFYANGQVWNPFLPLVLVEEDEFENGLDSSYWKGGLLHTHGTRVFPQLGAESQYYTRYDYLQDNPQANYLNNFNSSINKDILELTATDDDISRRIVEYNPDDHQIFIGFDNNGDSVYIDNLHHFEYRAGELISRRRYKHGYFSMGFQMPVGFGYWPAFWLHGANPSGYNEVDIIEFEGDKPNLVPTNIHHKMNPGDTTTYLVIDSTNNSLGSTWNVLGLEWQPHPVVDTMQILYWFFNNVSFRTEIIPLEFDPMNVYINFAVGGPPFADDYTVDYLPGQRLEYLDLSSTPFPAGFKVDFMRVYQRLDCNRVVDLKGYDNFAVHSAIQLAGNINVAGNGNAVIIDDPDHAQADNEGLKLIATNQIRILPGFHAEFNSDFHAKTMDCPYNTKAQMQESYIDDDYYYNTSNSSAMIKKEIKRIESEIEQMEFEKKYLDQNNQVLSSLEVYPNPSTGEIFVNWNTPNFFSLKLFGLDGKIAFEQLGVSNNQSINLPVKSGVYILELYDGKTHVRKRIIIN